jgi:hypothetical protein
MMDVQIYANGEDHLFHHVGIAHMDDGYNVICAVAKEMNARFTLDYDDILVQRWVSDNGCTAYVRYL